jgi:hypothetical protein
LTELETLIDELTTLIQKINQTNSRTILADNLTISDALAQRDMLSLKRSVYNSLLESASYRQNRYSLTEIKSISTVNIAEIQGECVREASRRESHGQRLPAIRY